MTDSVVETSIQVLGKLFQIKCSESQAISVREASNYLDEKMRYFRQQGMSEFDKVAVIAALNITDQLLSQESNKQNQMQSINQRLQNLHDKIERALEIGQTVESV